MWAGPAWGGESGFDLLPSGADGNIILPHVYFTNKGRRHKRRKEGDLAALLQTSQLLKDEDEDEAKIPLELLPGNPNVRLTGALDFIGRGRGWRCSHLPPLDQIHLIRLHVSTQAAERRAPNWFSSPDSQQRRLNRPIASASPRPRDGDSSTQAEPE